MAVLYVDNVIGKLKDLELKQSKAVTRKALRAGAKVIQRAAQANAPIKSGEFKRSIKVRAGKSSKGLISIVVGVGKKWFTGKTFYAAFVEFGHKIGKRPSKGVARSVGDRRAEVEGKHTIQTAFEFNKERALAAIEAAYHELLD